MLESSTNENADSQRLNLEISRLQSENVNLSATVSQLCGEIEEFKRSNASVNEDCKRLNEKLTQELENSRSLQAKLTEEMAKSSELTLEKAKLLNQKISKNKNSNDTNSAVASLEAKVLLLATGNEELSKNIETFKSKVKELEGANEKLLKDNGKLLKRSSMENVKNTPKSDDAKRSQDLLNIERNKTKSLTTEVNSLKEVLEQRLTEKEFQQKLPKVLRENSETFVNIKRENAQVNTNCFVFVL